MSNQKAESLACLVFHLQINLCRSFLICVFYHQCSFSIQGLSFKRDSFHFLCSFWVFQQQYVMPNLAAKQLSAKISSQHQETSVPHKILVSSQPVHSCKHDKRMEYGLDPSTISHFHHRLNFSFASFAIQKDQIKGALRRHEH